MRIIVIGSGYVGETFSILMEGLGNDVFRITKSGNGDSIAMDVSNVKSVQSIRDSIGDVDAVIHCASSGSRGKDRIQQYQKVYVEGCQNLVESFSDSMVLFVSSSSVYGQSDESIVDEKSKTEPPANTSKLLLEAERIALDANGSVARLSGIYGPGRSYLLKRYLEGTSQIDGFSSDSSGRWINQIHRDDAAQAIAHIIEKKLVHEVFNVNDDQPLLQRDCYQEFDRRFKNGIPKVREPQKGKVRGWSNKRVSNLKIKKTGWQPKYSNYFDALDNDLRILPSITDNILRN